ncbi:FecR family protein [Algoriphagus sp. NG3]|uniref:FecR family protein n=1 Tax=Algoriphagus sp. NG3 TaxID=3097546 RepID=UPI002A7FAFEA|nr:FecR domain-containing protein [Algoriphagus sp. NG3]WPR76123.1 DUF4974 domain-containing protein [Algoriphagus sp. NG3]
MNVPEDQIDQILTKWLTNTANDDELEVLRNWASQSEENLELMETFQKVWKEKTAEPILVNVDERIHEIWERGMLEKPKKSQRWKLLAKYAAAIFIVISSSFWVYHSFQSDKTGQEDLLALAPSFVVRENKPGLKTKISLPDGSIAYLNSSSSLRYLSGFTGDERRVYLEGEAYFEVAKDVSKPFVVESATIETLALGTAFNVNAFNDGTEIRVSLVEGEVRVSHMENNGKSVTLNPGKEILVIPESDTFLESSFEVDEVIGWKAGNLVFRHAPIEEVSKKLERWYGVEIKIVGEVPSNWKVTTVYKNQTLENVLTDLQYSKKFAYEINDSNVTIKF